MSIYVLADLLLLNLELSAEFACVNVVTQLNPQQWSFSYYKNMSHLDF